MDRIWRLCDPNWKSQKGMSKRELDGLLDAFPNLEVSDEYKDVLFALVDSDESGEVTEEEIAKLLSALAPQDLCGVVLQGEQPADAGASSEPEERIDERDELVSMNSYDSKDLVAEVQNDEPAIMDTLDASCTLSASRTGGQESCLTQEV
jgi:hypothetical protein